MALDAILRYERPDVLFELTLKGWSGGSVCANGGGGEYDGERDYQAQRTTNHQTVP
jgi:hypothetical protein